MTAETGNITPYENGEESKKTQVRRMFDRIAPTYDFLNHTLSLGMDIRWRKKAIAKVGAAPGQKILDIATGTGDVAVMLGRKYPGAEVHGIDISSNMLKRARAKAARYDLSGHVEFSQQDSENLLFADNSYDKATVAFGVRNFEDLQAGLREIYRVLKPGGRFVVLEFTKPGRFPFRQVFALYFKHILPFVGTIRSGDKRAYRYLYESVQAFPDYEDFIQVLEDAGFVRAQFDVLSLGICAIYTAHK